MKQDGLEGAGSGPAAFTWQSTITTATPARSNDNSTFAEHTASQVRLPCLLSRLQQGRAGRGGGHGLGDLPPMVRCQRDVHRDVETLPRAFFCSVLPQDQELVELRAKLEEKYRIVSN